MKKTKEWLSELPTEVSEKAIANTPANVLDSEADSLKTALFHAFQWDNSPEGFEYWDKIWMELK